MPTGEKPSVCSVGTCIVTNVVKTRPNRKRRERRVFIVTFVVCTLLGLAVIAFVFGPAYVAYWKYSPQEGDIIFQSLPRSRLVNAIEGVTQSPYSHCGIVSKQDDAWVVYEAYRNVEVTPLKEFIFRGRNQGFAVYRLNTNLPTTCFGHHRECEGVPGSPL